ncbi:TetR/AcrR family transcriptional regulator [Abyssalbus ytuae]|uniref:TetR/AcrR family transcriptional regulator n=1 Tax=Abyssalbus ytuae TaxID=2926907 RepID=A0A9E6ZTQ9_9FLAO|nr:TetR/AcrR family transcriptional regulator [Abyssalbus ytuae]UOB17638.1 TetR/AcrR family transcriptional regulator [Abyssalbus ytuae]
MLSKAEKTTQFIIEKVAPLFNRKGYFATSLSDITKVTGLTKGAIYGNFQNKEELAVIAFEHNVSLLLTELESYMNEGNTPLEKLFKLTDFYRNYYDFSRKIGGCPVLNMGVDAKHLNKALQKRVENVINRIQEYIGNIINDGKQSGEIKNTIVSRTYAKRFYSLLQGAIFMSQTMDDNAYVIDAANIINDSINMYFKK